MKHALLIFILYSYLCLSSLLHVTRRYSVPIVRRAHILHFCDPEKVNVIAESLYGVFMLAMLGVWATDELQYDNYDQFRFMLHFGG